MNIQLFIDNQPLLQTLTDSLRAEGYTTFTEDERLTPDVFVGKLTLSELFNIHQKKPNTHIIILADQPTTLETVRFMRGGAAFVLDMTTLTQALLLEAVETTLNGHRCQPMSRDEALRVGNLTIDPNMQRVTFYNQRLDLTPTEFRILWRLALSPRQVVSFEELARHISRDNNRYVARQTLTTHVTNLRNKLDTVGGREYVVSVFGQGYRLDPDVPTAYSRTQQALDWLTHHAEDLIASVDSEHIIRSASPSVLKILGHPPEYYLGRNGFELMELIHPSDRQRYVALLHVERQAETTMRYRVRHANGHYVWVEGTIRMHGSNGQFEGATWILRNITEQKKLEDMIQETDQRHRMVMELSTDFYYGLKINENGGMSLSWISDSFFSLVGCTWDDLANAAGFLYIHPDDRELVMQKIYYVIQTGEDVSFEYRQLTVTGDTRQILERLRARRDETTGQVVEVVGVGHDITENKRAEKQALELAVERERVDLLATFIQAARHEFNTPLSVIRTNVYLLNKLFKVPDVLKYTQRIDEQATKLNRLVEDLSTLAKLDSGIDFSLTRVSLNSVINSVIKQLAPQVEEKQHTLTVELEEKLPRLLGNMEALGQAVRGVLENAIRFTPDYGSITIRTFLQDKNVVLTIHDTGIGIAEENLSLIFHRFFRVDKSYNLNGFGLGLTIALKIMEFHGGTITVESTLKAGSTFSLVFPLDGLASKD